MISKINGSIKESENYKLATQAEFHLLNKLKELRIKNSFIFAVDSDENYYYINKYNNRTKENITIEKEIENVLYKSFDKFTDERLSEIENKLDKINEVVEENTGDLTSVEKDYSEFDSDEMYNTALYTGIFGGRKFKEGHFFSGLGYLLTCGGCGIFYIMDLILFLVGVQRDGKREKGESRFKGLFSIEGQTTGKLYRPLSDRKTAFKKFFISIPIAIICVFIYINFIVPTFTNILSDTMSDVITEENVRDMSEKFNIDNIEDLENYEE